MIATHTARTASRRAFSLVEVLVVLAILSIGILALVPLFAQSLSVNSAAGHGADADNVARSTLEALDGDSLPDGIVGLDPVTLLPDTTLTLQNPFATRPYAPDPSFVDPRWSYLNRMRRIIGEQFRVPPPATSSPYLIGGSPISLYTLKFSPLYSDLPTDAGLGLAVYGASSLGRLVYAKPPTLEQLADINVGSYAINYDLGLLFLRAGLADRHFRVQYRWRRDSGGTALELGASVRGLCIVVPADQVEGVYVVDLRDPSPQITCALYEPLPADAVLDEGTDRVRRVLDRLDPADPFSDRDPYQYKSLNPFVGLLGLNPLAAAITPPVQLGPGLLLKADYDVDDWHIVREIRAVSLSPEEPTTSIGLPPIKQFGEVEDNLNVQVDAGGNPVAQTPQYQGLVRSYPGRPGTPGADVVVLDVATGRVMDNRSLLGPLTQLPFANGEIDYARGVIRFAPQVQWLFPGGDPADPAAYGPPEPISGKEVAIYYRTLVDWAIFVEKPFDQYRLQLASPVSLLAPGEYLLTTNSVLLLPLSDVGKNVMVDYSWKQQDATALSGLRTRSERGEIRTIFSPNEPGNPAGNTLFGWLQLGRPDVGAPAGPAPVQTVVPGSVVIDGVRGASVNVRIIWREGGRWRQAQRDTLLPRRESP